MSGVDGKLWPFSRKASVLSAVALLIGLPVLLAILHATLDWPSAQSESVVLIGIFVLGMLPVLLVLLDIVIERGAVVEYRGVKVDFSQSRVVGTVGITVAPNIGVPGQAVYDSSTVEILDALKHATTSDVAVIDLERGQAWWETRLMVFLAGAERISRPDKVVFVGTDAGREREFQGWAYVDDLFRCLLDAHPDWAITVRATRIAAREWELVEPTDSSPAPATPPAAGPRPLPAPHPWFGPLAQRGSYMAFDPTTGRPNEFLAEQLLQSELGREVEQSGNPEGISLVRLEQLFRSLLRKENLDLAWDADRQVDTVLDLDAPYIAMTQRGEYSALATRLALTNELVKSLVRAQEPSRGDVEAQ